MNKIFVGNLPYKIDESEIANLFREYGEVIGVNIRKDRKTDKSKGFAFVTFAPTAIDAANHAISKMHLYEHEGRKLTVNLATARGSNNDNDKNVKVEKKNMWDAEWSTPNA